MKASGEVLNIMIGGEAGQGLVTIGQILAKSLVRSGYHIVVTQEYMSRIRGGHNTFSIRVSENHIVAPQESIDLLVCLTPETISLHKEMVEEKGIIVSDADWGIEGDNVHGLPFKELVEKKYQNTVALGAASALLGLDPEVVKDTMCDMLGAKHEEDAEPNRDAVAKGFEWAIALHSSVTSLKTVQSPHKRMFMNGNEAIALGALSAGVKFLSFYPMTPATSIALNIITRANAAGVVAEQAEDEIAAINMALGASFAGAPALVPTSGGGFALMTEGVSLAGMTETPVVIAIAQRPGPATGLPTQTEQGDLEFALFGGHGEFPRAIFSPGCVEECYYLTRKAFEIAERYQTPVIILTDQFLADSYRAIEKFPPESCVPVCVRETADIGNASYKRFALTESGVSPLLLPGESEHLVRSDSDEHTEEGMITEDHQLRVQMVKKRLKKMEGIKSDIVPPLISGGEGNDIFLVAWGSTKGSVCEAAAALRKNGTSVGVVHFPQVWPLVPDTFLPFFQDAKEVVSVEGNATGQFASLIRRETGFHIKKRILRYDGLPITPESILREM